MKLIIGVDVDLVVADLIPEWLARYNRDWQDSLTSEDCTSYRLERIVRPECGVRIADYLKAPDLYDNVQPIADSQEGVKALRDMGHEIVFITACGSDPETISAQVGAKFAWLQRWGFLPTTKGASHNYVVASEKRLVRVDLMIDDRPETISAFGSRGIIFDQPHNREWHHYGGYRVQSWRQIPMLVREYASIQERNNRRING